MLSIPDSIPGLCGLSHNVDVCGDDIGVVCGIIFIIIYFIPI